MKRNTCLAFTLTLVFFLQLLVKPVIAQINTDTSVIWQIETVDGNKYRGKIMRNHRKRLDIKTEDLGTFSLDTKDVINKEKLYDPNLNKDTELLSDNKLLNRYMLSPTGMLQHESKGYYENRYALINHVNIAPTKNFSIGAGMMPLFFFDSGVPIWVTPKFRIKTKNDKLKMSGGLFLAKTFVNDYSDEEIALVYYVVTYGTPNLSVNAGIAYGYFFYEWMEAPAFSLGGTVRVNKNTYLFIENFILRLKEDGYDDPEMLYVVGFRKAFPKIVLDIGFGGPTNSEQKTSIAIPYLGVIAPF